MRRQGRPIRAHPVKSLTLFEPHNLENVLAALLITDLCGVPMPKAVEEALFKNESDFSSDEAKHWYRQFELKGEIGFTHALVDEGFQIEDVRHGGRFVRWHDKWV